MRQYMSVQVSETRLDRSAHLAGPARMCIDTGLAFFYLSRHGQYQFLTCTTPPFLQADPHASQVSRRRPPALISGALQRELDYQTSCRVSILQRTTYFSRGA